MKIKSILILLLSIFLFSCNNNTNKTATELLARKKKLQDSIANNIVDSITNNICKKISTIELGMFTSSKITKLLDSQFDSLDTKHKEKIFLQFKERYNNNLKYLSENSSRELTNSIGYNDNSYNILEKEDLINKLAANGAIVVASDGACYIDEKPDYLYKIFKGKISDALTQYLKLNSKELKESFSFDACLSISFEQLYKRVINWEDFINKNPNFFLEKEAKDKYTEYLGILLSGMDNSPIYEYEPAKLLPEIKRLYEKIIAKHESRNSTKVITEFYNKLKKNNFIRIVEVAQKESSTNNTRTNVSNSTQNSSTKTSTQTLPYFLYGTWDCNTGQGNDLKVKFINNQFLDFYMYGIGTERCEYKIPQGSWNIIFNFKGQNVKFNFNEQMNTLFIVHGINNYSTFIKM
jgi:hypothetical protein